MASLATMTRLPRCTACIARCLRANVSRRSMNTIATGVQRTLLPKINGPEPRSRQWPRSQQYRQWPPFSRLVSSSSSKSASAATPEPLYPTREPTAPPDDAESAALPTSPHLQLTDRATAHLARLCEREANERLALRLAVEPGGCHGYQYSMAVIDMDDAEEGIEEDDFLFTSKPKAEQPWTANLLVDRTSLTLLSGSTLDYATELIGSQFVVRENPNAKGAGCGCGVSWEPKDGVGMSASSQASTPGPGEIDIGIKGHSTRRESAAAT